MCIYAIRGVIRAYDLKRAFDYYISFPRFYPRSLFFYTVKIIVIFKTRNFAKLIVFRIIIADMDLISSNVKYLIENDISYQHT